MTIKEKPLKKKQIEILNAIDKFTNKEGFPPSFRDILEITEIKSISTVHHNINKLSDKGYLTYDPTKPRTIKLTEKYRNMVKTDNPINLMVNIEFMLKTIQTTIATNSDPSLNDKLNEVNQLVEEAFLKIKK